MAKTREQILQEAMSANVVPQSAVPTVGAQRSRQEILNQAMTNVPRAQQFQQAIQADPLANALYSLPGTRPLMEFANAAGRSVADVVDFFGPDVINSILQISGTESRVPTIRGSLESIGAIAPAGSYMQPGLGQQIVSGAGEAIPMAMGAQGLLRAGMQRLPQTLMPSTARRVAQSMASTTPAQEAVATAGAVTGGEVGKASGIPGAELAGAIVGGGVGVPLISNIDRMLTNRSDFAAMAGNMARVRTDVAGEMLAKSLRASGLSVDDAMKQYRALGRNALPADIDQSFREILRAAMNVDEGISGQARRMVNQRQAGSGARIAQSLDIISTDNLDDYLRSVDATLGPQVRDLYDQAAQRSVAMPPALRARFEGDSAIGRVQPEVQRRLADRRAMGEQVSNFNLIDETKRALDDQIGAALRGGQNQEARRLIQLKNFMVREADSQIPEYRQARELYAGRMALDDAATLGAEIFQTNARNLRDLTSQMTQPERNAYILAAKDAILNRIDGTGMNRNQVQALFGKNGDAMKLGTLFTENESRQAFMDNLRRETEFAVTRNAVIGNSTTAGQLQRIKESLMPAGGYKQVIGQAASLVTSPTQLAREVSGIIDNMRAEKGSDLYLKGLVQAGDILLTAGMDANVLRRMLETGSVDRLSTELRRIAAPNYSGRAATVTGVGAQQTTEE
ncbi:hypothetical protein UFOVP412_19 [uncultured Caudovirales phage]|uniref:Uncharacterized protein n=1 Tax=uncultured Caudovirales phage TaxID=2100421 RepID=A0A6J5M6P0_9CAUD|nr:hypothetical protein UFOVP412_19 [uncultured Caudovirales phage]